MRVIDYLRVVLLTAEAHFKRIHHVIRRRNMRLFVVAIVAVAFGLGGVACDKKSGSKSGAATGTATGTATSSAVR